MASSSSSSSHSTWRQDSARHGQHQDADEAGSGATEFIRRLFRLLEDGMYPDVIAWSPPGDSFIIKDMGEFAKTVSPRIFQHSNYSSFVRQLNKYDFHKIKNLDLFDDLNTADDSWVFKHPDFRRGHPAGLEAIKRKPTRPKRRNTLPLATTSQSPDGAATLQETVAALTRTTEELFAFVRSKDAAFVDLQNEVAGLQRTIEQQGTIVNALATSAFDVGRPVLADPRQLAQAIRTSQQETSSRTEYGVTTQQNVGNMQLGDFPSATARGGISGSDTTLGTASWCRLPPRTRRRREATLRRQSSTPQQMRTFLSIQRY